MRATRYLIIMLVLVILTGCSGAVTPRPTSYVLPSPTPTAITLSPTSTQMLVPPTPSATSTPTIHYQLTFMQDEQSIMGMDVICLESEHLCFSEPRLLIDLLAEGNEIQYPGTYRWSPEGNRIAICALGAGGKDDIYWTSIDDIQWRNITNHEIYECNPNWMIDGERIVYEANSFELYGGHRVFSILATGEEPIQLLSQGNLGGEQQLALSPDGNRVAFIHSDDNGFYQLFLADLDGSDRIQLTNLDSSHFSPTFSPDGEWLAFIRITDPHSYTDLHTNIVIRNLETGEEIILYTSDKVESGNYAGPAWALSWDPTGNWIAFMSNIEGSYDIFLIRVDGSEITRLTSNPGDESTPQWRTYYDP